MTPDAAVWLLATAGAVALGYRASAGRAARRRCDRYGHAPTPDTLGTRRERCGRCGARLR